MKINMLEAIGTDLKLSIDDLICEIKKIHQDLYIIKQKLNLDKTDKK